MRNTPVPPALAGAPIDTIVFDLGNVLIPWDPRRLYRKLLASDTEVEWFLRDICPMSWHMRQDAGRSLAEATAERLAIYPQHEELIRAFYDRVDEMFDEAIPESVTALHTLKRAGHRMYALTNWPGEMFPPACLRYPFLNEFDGIVVSSREGLLKPDPALYRILFERHSIDPLRALFIDDSLANVEASRALGMRAIHFRDPGMLAEELAGYGVRPEQQE